MDNNLEEIVDNKDAGDGYADYLIKKYKQGKKKPVPMVSEKDAWYYRMNHKKRGIAVIFNHEKFDIPTLKSRSGTHADCFNLEDTLKSLGFEVEKYLDLDVKQLDNVLDKLGQYDYTDCDSLLIAVLSHGEQGILYARDVAYKPDSLFDRFTPDRCPSLAGKPKIYLIQACQGDRLDGGVELQRTHVDSGVNNYRIPLRADFLVVYSTIPGYYSWRNTQKGSWFVQAFCEEMNANGKVLDLLTILTFVNRRVAVDYESNVPDDALMHKQKQIPCITSMLTRIVKFSSDSNSGDAEMESNHKGDISKKTKHL